MIAAARRFTTRHRGMTCLLAAVLPAAIRLSLLPYAPIPEPEIHDEFAYLLGADTFASGRLANPPHPMWTHFETFHVNQQPTYVSKYPPAQSLFLALGQAALEHPWYGVLLSVGLMCACICWMLQGWLRPHYAFLGALLAIANFGVTGYWVNSYWGGAVPAAGGALVLGGLPRLVRRESAAASLLAAFGVVLLANSRPYEGTILTIACAAVLLWWRKRQGRSLRALLTKRVVLPFAILFASGLIWFGYYNWRTTGTPWLMPYVVNQRTYAVTPQFWLAPEGPMPTYRHEILRKIWAEWYREFYSARRANPVRVLREFVEVFAGTYSMPILFSILIAVLLTPTPRVRIALSIAAAVAFGVLLEVMVLPHYYAPAAGLMFLLAAVGVQHVMHAVRKQGAVTRTLNTMLFAALFLGTFAISVRQSMAVPTGFPADRQKVIATLRAQGSSHLVIVRYAPDHNAHYDWVRNRANIDESEIVWAHDMGEAENRKLLAYYPNRTVWLLEPDAKPEPRLQRYSE